MAITQESPRMIDLEAAALIDTAMHPRENEGIFYTGVVDPQDFYDRRALDADGLPVYDTEVAAREMTNIRHIHPGVGKTWVEDWEMTDGTRHNLLFGKSSSNPLGMLIVKDTAWITQVEGFNHDVALMLMGKGFDVLIKGPERGTSLELAQNAHHTHKILDKVEEIGISKTSNVGLEGYSRGSMIGFGTIGRARLHDRKIVYANLTDACVARSIEYTLAELLESTKGAPAELLTIAHELGVIALHPTKLWHYRKTFDATVDGMMQIVRTGLPLFTGESGILAGQMPKDTQATAAFFRNSLANHRRLYKEIIKGKDGDLRPGIETKLTPGGHGRGMAEKILGNIGLRFSRLGDQLREGALPEEIDFTKVHHSA
jgi:hypothetical protein